MDKISEQKLSRLASFLEEVRETTASNKKKEILKSYVDIKDLFARAYNYDVTYGISDKLLEKTVSDRMLGYDNLDELLDDLRDRKITGHDAVYAIQSFTDDDRLKDALVKIITKDFKVRLGFKLINSAIPECVKVFNVALAENIKNVFESKNPINYLDGSYYSSIKFDGVRLVCRVNPFKNEVHTYSREGNEFTSLENLNESLIALAKNFCKKTGYKGVVVFDGEAAIQTADGSDDFKAIVGMIKRFKEGFCIPRPKYNVFDVLTEEQFYENVASPYFTSRMAMLKEIVELTQAELPDAINKLKYVEQIQITSQEQLDELFKSTQEKKQEGLILRKNIRYESGRSKNLLKVKKFHDMELTVIDVVFGDVEVAEDGVQKTEKMLLNVVVQYGDVTVNVGSGFSREERRKFFKDPSLIVGKEITVQYFEATTDKTGKPSLRFPIFKKCVFKEIRDYE